MKVSSFQAPYGLTRITSRREGDGGAAQNTYERMGGKKEEGGGQGQSQDGHSEAQSEQDLTVTDEQVAAAINAYTLDTQTLESGLSVSTEGMGSALLILLKDAQGQILRKLSGPEFVKLRENTDSKGIIRLPGKFLDQKY